MKTTYDAIVIGAGVLGASVAASLASGGYSVLILERGEPACGASGGNLGQISITDRYEPWHMKLAVRSLDYYETVLSKEYDIDYVQSGGSILLNGRTQTDAAKQAMAQLEALGVPTSLHYGDDIRSIEPGLSPESAEALLYCPLEGKLNPFAVTLAFLDKATAAGAELKRNTPVTSFQKSGCRVTGVKTPEGLYSAEWVVNCTGPRASFLGRLADTDIPVCFHKGTAFVSQPVSPLIRRPICGGGFLLKGGGEPPQRQIGFATVQTAGGSILIAQSTEICNADDKTVNMPSLTLVAKRFLTCFPQLSDMQIVRAWAAVTTYTKDDLPVFGFSQSAENLFTAAGFKGAFTVAPAVGQITKAALEGRGDPEYLCCSPDRRID